MMSLMTGPQTSPALLPEELRFIQPFLDQLLKYRQKPVQQTYVTLSYAQSIDGSISGDAHSSLPLSGAGSLTMTHVLRAHHDALLVGINTILVDDPQLNVRYYQGQDPTPVILDCQLRFPEQARVINASSRTPLIITTEQASATKKARLEDQGVQVHTVEQTQEGRINLIALRHLLTGLGIKTVMVEGGSEVINEFLNKALVDYCVITLAPKIIGGLKAVEHPCQPVVEIPDCQYQQLGADLIIYGSLMRNGT